MAKPKHSKYKNTGIIYEILVNRIALDTMSNKDSKALDIIKRYFSKGELYKELKIYEALYSSNIKDVSKAELLVSTALDMAKRLNSSLLRRDKYNLIREIKSIYNLDEFFSSKIKNYKVLASISNLIEYNHSYTFADPLFLTENKSTLISHITRNNQETIEEDNILREFANMDKETRFLSYKILLEKFNQKYGTLDKFQRQILKEFIYQPNNSEEFISFINLNQNKLINQINKLIPTVEDNITSIKLKETLKLFTPVEKEVKDDNVLGILQCYQLLKELKSLQE